MHSSYIFSAAALAALLACREGKDVEGDCGTSSGGISNADYEFKEYNFSCDTDPIDTGFRLNSESFYNYAGLSTGAVEDDFEEAVDAWSTTGADLTVDIRSLASINDEIDGTDGKYQVFMAPYEDLYDDDESDLATAFQWNDGNSAIDCDIVVWSEDQSATAINWKAGGTPSSTQFDLAYAFAHELGHCIGIDDQEAPSTVNDVMYGLLTPGVDFTGLAQDEIDAAEYLYGEL